MTVNGSSAFYTTAIYEDGFVVPSPPSNHAPIPDQDYLFFDIGDFAKIPGVVLDFSDESGAAIGEIKTLAIAVTDFDWVHFDVFALVTDTHGGERHTTLITTTDGNPGSHDLTWKVIPEPGTIMLLGTGLLSIAFYSRRKLRK